MAKTKTLKDTLKPRRPASDAQAKQPRKPRGSYTWPDRQPAYTRSIRAPQVVFDALVLGNEAKAEIYNLCLSLVLTANRQPKAADVAPVTGRRKRKASEPPSLHKQRLTSLALKAKLMRDKYGLN